MAKSIAFVNQKGGVGKTTSCVNLASCLRAAGARVLVCDFDPQGNATSGLGVDKVAAFPTVYEAIIGSTPAANAVVNTPYGDILPANKALAGATVEMINLEKREFLLRDALGTGRALPNLQPIRTDHSGLRPVPVHRAVHHDCGGLAALHAKELDRKSTRLNSSH